MSNTAIESHPTIVDHPAKTSSLAPMMPLVIILSFSTILSNQRSCYWQIPANDGDPVTVSHSVTSNHLYTLSLLPLATILLMATLQAFRCHPADKSRKMGKKGMRTWKITKNKGNEGELVIHSYSLYFSLFRVVKFTFLFRFSLFLVLSFTFSLSSPC
jgi:hypothetical protein